MDPMIRVRQLAVLLLCLAAGGCNFKEYRFGGFSGSRSDSPGAAGAPQPKAESATETGSSTVSLQYALPGRSVPPTTISWTQIDITDEAGRPCGAPNIHLGRSSEGYWTSISFSYSPEAKKLYARLVLTLDETDYPLHAVLTRVDGRRWRVDYGIIPPRTDGLGLP